MIRKVIATCCILFLGTLIVMPTAAMAQTYTQDTGKIVQLYTSPSEALAIRLDGGFPNAKRSFTSCQSAIWAGFAGPKSAMTMALLSAQASGGQVTIAINGCMGAWFNILDIYVASPSSTGANTFA